jgi:hypothetical protein
MSESYKKESRKDWYLAGDAKPGNEHLQLGCLQRIADATELMAKRYADLIGEKERAESSRDYWRKEAERMGRRVTALRGQITKLKKKLGEVPRGD